MQIFSERQRLHSHNIKIHHVRGETPWLRTHDIIILTCLRLRSVNCSSAGATIPANINCRNSIFFQSPFHIERISQSKIHIIA